ncbi:calcium-binding protein [Acuticoccus sp. I52.16.1]|uniref:calcium-binding protein n=1 Tax=Acuticoccus sp. I52.16.1 TaxID=2928472 RepID=UPI001FD1B5C1|nr:calcium-binding protein [Acuticoccus sp. I52.16.1]UOM34097.1 hypothetical protein MRB58_20045 [Acuticoccus sp. I52.16.1]
MPFVPINGTIFADLIDGTGADELINARAGNDDVFGRGGNDILLGGLGRDFLSGGAGNDTLDGQLGSDTLVGGLDDDLMRWQESDGPGNDLFDGEDGYDQANFIGSDGFVGDNFTLASAGGRVEFNKVASPSSVSVGTTERILVVTRGGNDRVDAGALQAGMVELVIDGGGGNDELLGSQGDDTLRGAAGEDTLVGNAGDDTMLGGADDDLMIWNNGDGNDTMDGGDQFDTGEINGSDSAGDAFKVSTTGPHVLLERTNFGNFSVQLRNTELMEVNGQGGDDTIDGSLVADGFIQFNADGGAGDDLLLGTQGDDLLEGGLGDDKLVGNEGDDTMLGGLGDDQMVWNNGDGSDTMNGGLGDDIAIVNGSDGSGDAFVVGNTFGTVEFDRVNFGQFGLEIDNTETLVVNGLGGNDTVDAGDLRIGLIDLKINGGAGEDELIGSNGGDTLAGDTGNDTMLGARGDDLMIWRNGDGSDLMNGGANDDTALVEGADGAGDSFEISTNGGNVLFERVNFGNFTLDIRNTETLEVKGLAGNDSIDASALDNGLIDLELFGNTGNDEITGSAGNDTIDGGEDDDVMTGGAGADIFVYEEGADSITDFGTGFDRIEISDDLGFNFFQTKQAMTQVGADVEIDFGNGNVLTVENTAVNDLNFIDFIF